MRWFRGIKRRWVLNNLAPVILIIVTSATVVAASIANYYYSSMADQLRSKVSGNAGFFNRYVSSSYDNFYTAAKSFCDDFVDKDKIEMQVVGPGGEIMFSSSGYVTGYVPGTGDVKESSTTRNTVVYSGIDSATGQRVMSASSPLVYSDGTVAGVLRFISALTKADRRVLYVSLAALTIAVVAIALVLFSNYYFIRSIVNPIREINETAKKIAAGSYGARIDHAFNDEIGELADTINFMSVEIGRNEKLKNDFIASVSHELRTPLTAVTGWAETLADGGIKDPAMAARGLSVITRESESLRSMLEELLDFSRMQSGRFKMSMGRANLPDEVEDVMFTFEERLRQEGLEIEFDNRVGDVWMTADRARLRQVFVNILDNSRKHAKDGKKIEITLARSELDGHAAVRLDFRDHGPGIPEEDLPHVKEKFYKGKSRQPGSGIGLAVSNEIIAAHNGVIEVSNAPDGGAVVSIVLPVERAEE